MSWEKKCNGKETLQMITYIMEECHKVRVWQVKFTEHNYKTIRTKMLYCGFSNCSELSSMPQIVSFLATISLRQVSFDVQGTTLQYVNVIFSRESFTSKNAYKDTTIL